MITYKNMSLFDAPRDAIIVHAANAEGIWGSGIAAEILKRYPKQFKHYSTFANNIGTCVMDGIVGAHSGESHTVCNLITSSIDSKNPDSEETILINTTTAINDFLINYTWMDKKKHPIYSNKFNSGIFNVPWEKTAKILEILIDRYNIEWIVCEHVPLDKGFI